MIQRLQWICQSRILYFSSLDSTKQFQCCFWSAILYVRTVLKVRVNLRFVKHQELFSCASTRRKAQFPRCRPWNRFNEKLDETLRPRTESKSFQIKEFPDIVTEGKFWLFLLLTMKNCILQELAIHCLCVSRIIMTHISPSVLLLCYAIGPCSTYDAFSLKLKK